MTEKPPKRFTFKKSARLSSKKHIKELFENGSSFFLYPLKVLYLENRQNQMFYNQILITVPRKYQKKAVNRTRIKRLVREAYRRNQYILSESTDKKFFIAYIYVSSEISTYLEIESKLKESLVRLRNIAQK